MKFKIKGIGLDTTGLDYSPLKIKTEKDKINYVFTNPAANNDFIIDEYVKYLADNTVLITEINYVDGVDEVLVSHLGRLGRNKYNILLMNANLDYSQFDLSVLDIKNKNIVENFGLSYPESLEKLKSNIDYLEEIGLGINCVLLDISPLHFQKDIIEYCEAEEITIISTNPFGGWVNSGITIYKYSVPYLLNFTSVYSDVVLLSSRDMCTAASNINYLTSIISKQVENELLYHKDKNVDELIHPTKYINTAINVEGMVLPYESPSYIFDSSEVKFSNFHILPEVKEYHEKTDAESEVEQLIDVIYKTPDLGNDDYFVSLRYKIEEYLELSHQGWKKEIIKITDKIMYIKFTNIVVKKKWYGKLYESIEGVDRYLLFYSDGILKFKEILKKGEEIV